MERTISRHVTPVPILICLANVCHLRSELTTQHSAQDEGCPMEKFSNIVREIVSLELSSESLNENALTSNFELSMGVSKKKEIYNTWISTYYIYISVVITNSISLATGLFSKPTVPLAACLLRAFLRWAPRRWWAPTRDALAAWPGFAAARCDPPPSQRCQEYLHNRPGRLENGHQKWCKNFEYPWELWELSYVWTIVMYDIYIYVYACVIYGTYLWYTYTYIYIYIWTSM